MTRLPRTAIRLSVAISLLLTAGCKPWTTRPINAGTSGAQAKAGVRDVGAYVQSIWPDRVMQEARNAAIALAPGTEDLPRSAAAVFVRGTGRVVEVDERSRVRLALVDLAPGDGRPDVAIQIGPVLSGTALRDALPFIRFDDFANQIDYAAVSRVLHDRVTAAVLNGLDPASIRGTTVSFIAAAATVPPPEGRLRAVVPVLLERTGQ
jgi:predicted lipoprotein